MTRAVAIDLGAAWATLALSDGERSAVLCRGKSPLRIPAVVGREGDGELFVGDRARRRAITWPRGVAPGIASALGRRVDELDAALWSPLALVRGERGDLRVRLGDRVFAAPSLAAALLLELRHQAEELLGGALGPVVLTAPAHAGDAGRRALGHAAAIAGLDLLRLVHATTAAAFFYRVDRPPIDDEVIAVCDLGAGRFDAAVVEVREAGIEVLASRGVDDVGGAAMDARLVEWLLEAAAEQAGAAACADPTVLVRLRDAAEKARITLSGAREAVVTLPFLYADEVGPKHLQARLTQAKMEALVQGPIDRCVDALQRALADVGREATSLREIVLIGGAARMPVFQDRVEALLRRPPLTRYLGAGDVVARGAALVAAALRGEGSLQVIDLCGRELLLSRDGAEPELLLPRTAALPTSHTELIESTNEATSARFSVIEGATAGRLVAECELSGRPAVDVTFALDASGRLSLEHRQWARGKEATLAVRSRCGLGEEEAAALIAQARELEEHRLRQARARGLQQRLAGWIERGERALTDLGEGVAAGVRERLAGALQQAREARVVDSLEGLEIADGALEAVTAELPPALQLLLRGPAPAVVSAPDPLGPAPLVKINRSARATEEELEAEAVAEEP